MSTESMRRWRANNRQLDREKKRRARAANPEKKRAENQAYWAKNRERKRLFRRNRKALERGGRGKHTLAAVAVILKMQRGRCAYCRQQLDEYHVDHIVPLSRGGTNRSANLQLTCSRCNRQKGAKDPVEFSQSIGLLV
jgi:5-methylcytosine-specific restriction endonuclease McrA